MNEKATALGMEQTVFADASGLSADNVFLRLRIYSAWHSTYINIVALFFEITANQDLPTAYVSGEFGELQNS